MHGRFHIAFADQQPLARNRDVNVVRHFQRLRVHATELFLEFVHEVVFETVDIGGVSEEVSLLFDFVEIVYGFQLKVLEVPLSKVGVHGLPCARLEEAIRHDSHS